MHRKHARRHKPLQLIRSDLRLKVVRPAESGKVANMICHWFRPFLARVTRGVQQRTGRVASGRRCAGLVEKRRITRHEMRGRVLKRAFLASPSSGGGNHEIPPSFGLREERPVARSAAERKRRGHISHAEIGAFTPRD